MIAAAALADVMEEPRQVQHLLAREIVDQTGAQRIFVRMLRLGETTQVADDHQRVLVHRVHVEKVVLHLADDAPEHRQIRAEDARQVHPAQCVRQSTRLTEQCDEARAIGRVAAKRGVDPVAAAGDRAQRARGQAFQLRVPLECQERVEYRRWLAFEQLRIGDVQQLVDRAEIAADRDRHCIGREYPHVQVLQQDRVDQAHSSRRARVGGCWTRGRHSRASPAQHSRHRIDAAFRRDPANRARFIALFREPRGLTHALRRMNLTGVLGAYLPVFGRIVGQMQHDLFHVYTVDEHTLMVIRNLRRFTEAQHAHEYPLCSRLINDFARKEVLYLAGLFHDIGKGRGGDHSALGERDAQSFCRAHALPAEDAALVAWLVANHLAMSSIAQKADLSDPQVIAAFAARVGDERRLTALYLLTVADIRGTSPRVWNAWKAQLLEELINATRRVLSGGDAGRTLQDSVQQRQDEARALLRLHAVAGDCVEPQ